MKHRWLSSLRILFLVTLPFNLAAKELETRESILIPPKTKSDATVLQPNLFAVSLQSALQVQPDLTLPVRNPEDVKVGQEFFWRSTTKASMTTFGGKEKSASLVAVQKSRVISIEGKLLRIAVWRNGYAEEPSSTTWGVVDTRWDVFLYLPEELTRVSDLEGNLLPIHIDGNSFWSFAHGKPRSRGDIWETDKSEGSLSRFKYTGIEVIQGVRCCKVEVSSFRGNKGPYNWIVFLRGDGSLQKVEASGEGEFMIDGVRGTGKIVRTIERLEKLPPKPALQMLEGKSLDAATPLPVPCVALSTCVQQDQGNSVLPLTSITDFQAGQEFYWRTTIKAEMKTFGGKDKNSTVRWLSKSRVLEVRDDNIRYGFWIDPWADEPSKVSAQTVRTRRDQMGWWSKQFTKIETFDKTILQPHYTGGREFWAFACGEPRKIGTRWETLRNDNLYISFTLTAVEAIDGIQCFRVDATTFDEGRRDVPQYKWTVWLRTKDGSPQRFQSVVTGEFAIDKIQGTGTITRTIDRLEKLPPKTGK